MTLCKYDFSYLASNYTHNSFVTVRTCSDLYTSLTQTLVNDYAGVIFPVFKYLNVYVTKSTVGVIDLLKGPSSTLMTCSESFRFNPNYVNRYRPKIILYLP